MKKWIALSMVLGMLVMAAMAAAVENKGAENITLNGGSRGEVPFPHHRHQNTLGACNQCHDVFPQQPGAIDEMKAAGALKEKQVMNKQCIKCHKARKKEGLTGGPTTCTACHVRKG